MKKVAKKTIKKEVSNEDLAVMVANGFSSLEERLSKKIDSIEGRLGNVEKTMATKADILELHDKFASKHELGQVSLRVSKLEEKTKR